MRWNLGIAGVLALASLCWGQEAQVLRAYGMEWNQFRVQDTNTEDGAFQLLGTAPIGGTEKNEDLFLLEPNTSTNVRDLAKDIIYGVSDELWVFEGDHQFLVRATEAQHRSIARALSVLRAQQEFKFEVEHWTLPRDLAVADRGLLAALIGGKLDKAGWKRLRELDRYHGARRGSVHAVAGEWARYEATREVEYLADYDVEIAQAAAIADPIMQKARDGVRVALRPFPLSDGRVAVRLVGSAGRLDDDVRRFSMKSVALSDSQRMRDTNYGDIEQMSYRGVNVATEAILPRGGRTAMLLGSTDPESDGTQILVLTLQQAGPVAKDSTVALLPIGALAAQHRDWRMKLAWGGSPDWSGEIHARATRLDRKSIKSATNLKPNLDLNATDLLGGSFLVRAPAEQISVLRGNLTELERELLRPVRLALQFQVVDDHGTRTLGTVSQPAMLGTRTAFGAYRSFDYVGDHDVEVAQESRISDPHHKIAVAGFLGDAEIDEVRGGQYRVRLSLTISAAGAAETIRPEAGGGAPLQRVRRNVIRVRPTLRLADGVGETFDLGANPYGEGRLTVYVRCDAIVR